MKISGAASLTAPPERVWEAFHDPESLARCLPGCETLTEVGPHQYAMTITAGVAAIKGTYDGQVHLTEQQHPEAFTLKAKGAGAPGTVDADVKVRLSPNGSGGTNLTYDADAAVGGVIGGVGQRMLAGVSKKMAGQFFTAVDQDIAGVRKPPGPRGARRCRGRARRSCGCPGVCRCAGSRRRCARAGQELRRRGRPRCGHRAHRRGGRRGPGEASLMRAFTAAAVQIAPSPEALAGGRAQEPRQVRRLHAPLRGRHGRRARRAARDGDDRVHPRLLHRELWDLVSELPGPVIEPIQDVARELGVYLCVGTYERGPERGVVYNSSVLIDRAGEVLGIYRKTHPFFSEHVQHGGWVTPGDTVAVCDTDLGRLGMIICFDGDYPELSRIQAVQGAEVILRPSALLRSADVWELTSRARAYDNHVFVVGANATGIDAAGCCTSATPTSSRRSATSSPRPPATRLGLRSARPRGGAESLTPARTSSRASTTCATATST